MVIGDVVREMHVVLAAREVCSSNGKIVCFSKKAVKQYLFRCHFKIFLTFPNKAYNVCRVIVSVSAVGAAAPTYFEED